MKIYIDILFLINFTYDYLILSLVNIVLRRNIKVSRLLMGALVGSISTFSIFIPLFNNLIVTLVISLIMITITFKYKDLIYLKNNIIYFYMISVIFGGTLYLVNLKYNNFYNPVDIYQRKILINFIGIIVIGIITYFLYKYTYKNNIINHQNYYNLKYLMNDKLIELSGFYDSGNLLKDPYKGRPIILINKEILKCDIKNKSPIYVPCHMINYDVLIKCYKPKLLIINDKVINNCLLGLWENTYHYDGINAIISGFIGDKIK